MQAFRTCIEVVALKLLGGRMPAGGVVDLVEALDVFLWISAAALCACTQIAIHATAPNASARLFRFMVDEDIATTCGS
jgi:hypothetical protein